MTEHDPKSEERVEDLDVPESESEDVKGGLLPASQQFTVKLQQKFSKIDIQGQKVNPGSLGQFGDGSV